MEWVETTGSSIEEAKELALDQLGVDSGDAEFEIVEEPKVGLFGRTRGAARVRARVSPKAPRPKTERRRRQKKSDGGGRTDSAPSSDKASESAPAPEKAAPVESATEREPEPARARSGGRNRGGERQERQERPRVNREPMELQEQIDVLSEFLQGLGTSFGLEVTTEATTDEEEVRVNISGDGLGVLVGPRLATLDAIQEIARNTLQRQADGREYARVVVDVQNIRQRRRDALTEFVTQAATQVLDEDVTVVFEVMSSADRKLVHDVTAGLDGVESASEGEDPRRRVVLRRS